MGGPLLVPLLSWVYTALAPKSELGWLLCTRCRPQVLGLFSLSMMSTAAIIGAGIFVLTGVVAKQAG